MTDEELERRLRAWYQSEIPDDEAAPTTLRSALGAIPIVIPSPSRRTASRRRIGMLAVAALVTTALAGGVLLGSGAFRRSPNPPPSDPAVVLAPSPVASVTLAPTPVASIAVASPRQSVPVATPSATPSSSLEPCVTDSEQVRTGKALEPVDGDGLNGLGQTRGVYLAGRTPRIWVVNPGADSASVIAELDPVPNILEILDISPDGSDALIRVGNISPSGLTPECADLYAIRTDGSGATRLTRFGTGRFVTGGAFSPDGRRVAYSWWDPGMITTLDLQTGATVDQPCTTVYSRWPTRIDWSPTGEAIAVGCGRTLMIFDASRASAPGTFLMAEEPLAYRWTDGPGLVVASGGGNVYHVDASGTSTVVGRFEDPSIEIVSGTGVLSPDGRWLAYHGGERGDVPGNDFTEVGYLVPTSGGRPTRIPGELVDTTTWSGDSRALVYITGDEGGLELIRLEAETFEQSTIGRIVNRQAFPPPYRQGIWRVP